MIKLRVLLKNVEKRRERAQEEEKTFMDMVEKEKEKIVELLEDYVREVHQNMDRIDANSTITIRERPVKMLKIQIPEWEENESLYQIRLQDLIDEVTKKGLGIFFERNRERPGVFRHPDHHL